MMYRTLSLYLNIIILYTFVLKIKYSKMENTDILLFYKFS